MKKTIKKVLFCLCTIIIVIFMAATAYAHSGRTDGSGGHNDNRNASGLGGYHYHCGGYPAHLHKGGYCPYTDVFPSSVQIKAPKTVLKKGESIDLTASVYPANSCDDSIYWSTSNSEVATVSSGYVVAKEYGTATITAESFNGKKKSIVITVKEITATKVIVSGLPEKEHYYIGDKFSLTSSIIPENVDNPTIVWSSSDKKIATVSKKGKVELIAEGKVEIRATASNGVVGKAVINVEEKNVESVDIAEKKMVMLLLEDCALNATVTPSDATHPEITWTAKDPSIVSVDENGKITAISCGKTTVTATSTNGISDSIVVKVNEIKAESLEIDGASSVLVESNATFTCTIMPEDTTVKIVEWSVDDESIATITEEGVLTAKKVGKVIVTAKQKDVSNTVSVEVLPIKVEDIIISMDTEEGISKGDTISFSAEVVPANATYPDVEWSVSDTSIATIDEDGLLTALEGGSVTVTATAGDGFSVEYEVFISAPIYTVLGFGFIGVAIGLVVIIIVKKRKKKSI